MWLLDGNVLVAMAIDTHVFHERVRRWFDSLSEPFATCAITEGTLVRLHMKLAVDGSAAAAWVMLRMNRITVDPDICNGKPVIKGTRITAQTVLEFLAAGDSIEGVLCRLLKN